MRRKGITLVLIGVGLVAALPAQDLLFSTEGRITAEEGEHSYSIGLERGIAVEVLAESDDFDSYIEARLPDGSQRSNDDYARLNAGFQATIAEAGTMLLTVRAVFPGESGSYRLTVRRVPTPQPIFPGETIRDSIGKDDESGGVLARRYRLNGEEDTRVVVDVRSTEFDPLIEARDSLGRVVRDDDGGESGYDSRISYQFEEDGFLVITVRGFFGSDLGEYEISVREANATVLEEIEGELSASDERGYDGAILDRIQWEGEESEEVTILLESTDFDAMLYVSDPFGRSIARDDDSGGNRNSMATLTMPSTGSYTIYVGSFDGTSVGSYRLTIYGAATPDR